MRGNLSLLLRDRSKSEDASARRPRALSGLRRGNSPARNGLRRGSEDDRIRKRTSLQARSRRYRTRSRSLSRSPSSSSSSSSLLNDALLWRRHSVSGEELSSASQFASNSRQISPLRTRSFAGGAPTSLVPPRQGPVHQRRPSLPAWSWDLEEDGPAAFANAQPRAPAESRSLSASVTAFTPTDTRLGAPLFDSDSDSEDRPAGVAPLLPRAASGPAFSTAPASPPSSASASISEASEAAADSPPDKLLAWQAQVKLAAARSYINDIGNAGRARALQRQRAASQQAALPPPPSKTLAERGPSGAVAHSMATIAALEEADALDEEFAVAEANLHASRAAESTQERESAMDAGILAIAESSALTKAFAPGVTAQDRHDCASLGCMLRSFEPGQLITAENIGVGEIPASGDQFICPRSGQIHICTKAACRLVIADNERMRCRLTGRSMGPLISQFGAEDYRSRSEVNTFGSACWEANRSRANFVEAERSGTAVPLLQLPNLGSCTSSLALNRRALRVFAPRAPVISRADIVALAGLAGQPRVPLDVPGEQGPPVTGGLWITNAVHFFRDARLNANATLTGLAGHAVFHSWTPLSSARSGQRDASFRSRVLPRFSKASGDAHVDPVLATFAALGVDTRFLFLRRDFSNESFSGIVYAFKTILRNLSQASLALFAPADAPEGWLAAPPSIDDLSAGRAHARVLLVRDFLQLANSPPALSALRGLLRTGTLPPPHERPAQPALPPLLPGQRDRDEGLPLPTLGIHLDSSVVSDTIRVLTTSRNEDRLSRVARDYTRSYLRASLQVHEQGEARLRAALSHGAPARALAAFATECQRGRERWTLLGAWFAWSRPHVRLANHRLRGSAAVARALLANPDRIRRYADSVLEKWRIVQTAPVVLAQGSQPFHGANFTHHCAAVLSSATTGVYKQVTLDPDWLTDSCGLSPAVLEHLPPHLLSAQIEIVARDERLARSLVQFYTLRAAKDISHNLDIPNRFSRQCKQSFLKAYDAELATSKRLLLHTFRVFTDNLARARASTPAGPPGQSQRADLLAHEVAQARNLLLSFQLQVEQLRDSRAD